MSGKQGRSGNRRQGKIVVASSTPTQPPLKPAGLSDAASVHWSRLLDMLPENVLTPIDGYEIEILANLLAQSDCLAARLSNDPADEKANRLYLQTFKEIHRLSSCFGLNPADRQRLKFEQEPEESDPVAEFLDELKAGRG